VTGAESVGSLLARRHPDFSACEDAVQEAMLAATLQWPRDGTPDDPAAWMIAVASRRMTDALRRTSAAQHRENRPALLADRRRPRS
jgi:predicted RNA polymerase sigma factor